MRLRTRIAALAVLVALVPAVLSSLGAVSIATTEASRASAQILVRDADAMASFADTWAQDQARALTGLLQVFPLEQATPEEQEALVQAAFLAVPTVHITALVGSDGIPLVQPLYLTEVPPPGTVLAGRRPASAARADALVSQLPLSDVLTGAPSAARGAVGPVYRVGEHVGMPIVARGPYGDGMLLGAEVVLDELAAEVTARTSAMHGVALLDANGESVLGGAHPLVDAQALAPLIRSRASVSYTLADGTEVRGAVAPVARLGGAMVVVEPQVVAERAGQIIRERTAWTALGGVLVAVALGLLLARSLAQPIDRLREVAMAVADGDLGRRAELSRSDEIGELSRAFDHMSARLEDNRVSLAAQQAKIEAFNKQLQQRVDEATAELRAAQEQLVRSGQLAAVTDVSAALAHELNNPLSGILGLAQILGVKSAEPGATELARRIEEQAERCREVVSAMTRLAAHEDNPAEADVVDLADVLHELLLVARDSLRQRGVTVVASSASTPCPIRVDTGFAVRALLPVVQTLCASLPDGSSVSAAPSVANGRVMLELHASAPIASDALRDERRAQGLGLWVSRQLLSSVGGTLSTPESPARTWTVSLPEAS